MPEDTINSAKNAGNAEMQRAQQEQARLEGKYGTLTPDEQYRESQTADLEKNRDAEYRRRAGLTGEQLISEEGDISRNLVNEIKGRQGLTGEQLYANEGELNRKIGQEALNDDPLAWLSPELELARTSVNAEANRRGVFGGSPEGGIRFEQLGRANVDLAVKAAAERIAQRNALASQYLTLGSNNRSDAGTLAERELSTKERSRAELQDFLSGQQSVNANAKARTTNAGMSAAELADRGIDRGYNTKIDAIGTKAGRLASFEQQGIDFGTDAAKAGLAALTGGASIPATSGMGGSGSEGSSTGRLTSLTGSDLQDRYASLR